MNDNELALRCIELAFKRGVNGDPEEMASQFYALAKKLTGETEDEADAED